MKTLVAGLTGGSVLLKEWEGEWQHFGGEEKDEVEGDDVEGDDEESDEEDGDEGDEEPGRKRKRPKFLACRKKRWLRGKTSTPAMDGVDLAPSPTCLRPRDPIPVRRSLFIACRFGCGCVAMERIRADVPSLGVCRQVFGKFCSHAVDWEDDEKSQCFFYASY